MEKLLEKGKLTATRVLRAIWLIPKRVYRLLVHMATGAEKLLHGPAKPRAWWEDFLFLVFDLLALPEFYETMMDWGKWPTRRLNSFETQLAKSVFGESLHLPLIRVDETASIACRKNHLKYVSYYTINSWGGIPPAIFIHELVHVWQYQQMGGAYIPRALRAQATKEGYDYGGVERLQKAIAEKRGLQSFNLEQQADIIADYYRVREGLAPAWGKATRADLAVYQQFVNELRET